MLQRKIRQNFALSIRQHKLFGIIGENAQTIRTRIDHEIDRTLLPFKVKRTIIMKNGRDDGKNTAIRARLRNHGSFPVEVSWLVEN